MKKYIIPKAEIVKVKAEAQLAGMWSGQHYIPTTAETSEGETDPSYNYGEDE